MEIRLLLRSWAELRESKMMPSPVFRFLRDLSLLRMEAMTVIIDSLTSSFFWAWKTEMEMSRA